MPYEEKGFLKYHIYPKYTLVHGQKEYVKKRELYADLNDLEANAQVQTDLHWESALHIYWSYESAL